MVSDVVANYNYDKSGNVLPSGAPVKRNYGLNWYEFDGQDSWRIKAESDGHLRRALVAVSASLGGQRFDSGDPELSGHSPKREKPARCR
jgi:hypothetical protein